MKFDGCFHVKGRLQRGTIFILVLRKSSCTLGHCGFLIFASLEKFPPGVDLISQTVVPALSEGLAADEFSHYGCRRDGSNLVGREGHDVLQEL